MKIKFYGTAAAEGVPALYCTCPTCEHARKSGGKDVRTRSQTLVNDDLLLDFPADTYLHVLQGGLPLHNIRHILITHAHSDHLYPGDISMRGPGFSNLDESKTLHIYGGSGVGKELIKNEIIPVLMERNIIQFTEVQAFRAFTAGEYRVTPLKADHGTENPYIYLIEKEGKSLLYAHDTGYFPEETMEFLKQWNKTVDLASFDCCYSLKHCEKGHMGFDEVRTMEARLKEIGVIDEKTVRCINHFSHNNGLSYEEMNEYARTYGYLTTYDGMETEF